MHSLMKRTFCLLFVLLWLAAGCAAEALPPTATPPAGRAVEDSTQVGKLERLLDAPVPTPRSAKPVPPPPNRLPTVTPTAAATRPSVLARLMRTPTPTPGASPSPDVQVVGSVGDVTVNVRGGPGTHYHIVGKVSNGDRFEVVGRTESGDWLRICCPAGQDAESWISAEFVTSPPAGGPTWADLPVAAIPPTPVAPVAAAGGVSAASLAAAPAVLARQAASTR